MRVEIKIGKLLGGGIKTDTSWFYELFYCPPPPKITVLLNFQILTKCNLDPE